MQTLSLRPHQHCSSLHLVHSPAPEEGYHCSLSPLQLLFRKLHISPVAINMATKSSCCTAINTGQIKHLLWLGINLANMLFLQISIALKILNVILTLSALSTKYVGKLEKKRVNWQYISNQASFSALQRQLVVFLGVSTVPHYHGDIFV